MFAVYGITVDYRHLSLIADYMTFSGAFKAMNRVGINTSSSPFQKMSFESTTRFLTEATLEGHVDFINGPSSRIVVGKVVGGGGDTLEFSLCV